MRPRCGLGCLGLWTVLGLIPCSAAAQTAPLSLTIEEALRRGVESAPRVAAAKAKEAASAAAVAAQAADAQPVVSTSAGYLRTNHVTAFGLDLPDGAFRTIFPDIPNNYQVHVEADVPIYTAGRIGAAVTAARDGQRAAEADLRSTEGDLRLEVATAYWNLVTARESVTVLEEALQRADASVSDARARVDAGFLPPSDLLSAQAERAREGVTLIQARHEAALAEVTLDRMIGAAPGQAIVASSPIGEANPKAVALAASPIGDLVARARQDRPELASLNAQAASLEASAEAFRASVRPSVAGFGTVQPARPNQLFVPRSDQWQTSWSLGVTVNWSVWDGGRARAEAAANSAEADATRRQVDDLDAGIEVEVRQRLLDLDADREALAASSEAVTAATEAHRVIAERFRAGVATSTDVLTAEVALLQTALDHTRLAAAARLDEARLLRAIGEQP